MKKLLNILYILIISVNYGYCIDDASQKINANLAQVFEIEKVIVENKGYKRDDFLDKIEIKSINKDNPNQHILTLSSLCVKLRTNSNSPIMVYADFSELKHASNQYNFDKNNLKMSPSSILINNPHDHIETEEFMPQAIVTKDAVKGDYNGAITFTLGAI